jgi:hypothetical protein
MVLSGEITLRTRSTRISAPPPGMLSRPAARMRSMTLGSGSLLTWPQCRISDGESPWMWNGSRSLICRNSSS